MLVRLKLFVMVFAAALLRGCFAAELDEMSQRLDDLIAKINGIDDTVGKVARQVMLQQLSTEESIRSTAASGIKAGRLDHQGTKSYFATTYTGPKVMAIHNHANSNRTIGLGEFAATVNGVEFRTRHNDYILVKAATANSENTVPYDAVTDITYPTVPETVSNKPKIEEQIVEMREYFTAWSTQNKTHRDYTEFFKPVLCYLEALWTTPDSDQVEESFLSDRHHLDAGTWHELQEKIMFSAYTGRKSRLENFAYLPTMITRIEDNKPVIAQWNYRILCHPLSSELPTGQLKIIDDFHSRMAYARDMKAQYESRAARFKVVPDVNWVDKRINYDILDELMYQIPGKNGYGSKLEDPGSDSSIAQEYVMSGTPLNAGYYHRWFVGPKDAMGVPYQHRAYNDENIFMAMTTQEKVAPMQTTSCNKNGRQCSTTVQRWSYAFPLEIIYLTPLLTWNPHNTKFEFGDEKSATDGLTPETAYETANMRRYYRTPAAFYSSTADGNADAADTSGGMVYIKDGDNLPKPVMASGISIHTNDIPGIGPVRIRYPILPLNQEGNAIWKEVDALKEMIMNPSSLYANLLYRDKYASVADVPVELTLRASTSQLVPEHTHRLVISLADIKRVMDDKSYSFFVTTETSLGHAHFLEIARTDKNTILKFVRCDGEMACWDGHIKYMHLPDDVVSHLK